MKTYDVIVIGHGASGTLVCHNLVELSQPGLKIAILEKNPEPVTGIAYSTKFDCHFLNVPAKKMSGLANTPLDFLEYLTDEGKAYEFIPRKIYGDYLKEKFNNCKQLASAKAITLDSYNLEAASCQRTQEDYFDIEASGEKFRAKYVILAIGNSNKIPSFFNSPAIINNPNAILQAWDFERINNIKPDSNVCIVGSGLTMIDIIMSLQANNFTGKVDVVSRHGYAPLPHDLASYKYNLDINWQLDSPRMLIKQFKHELKKLPKGTPWQSLIDSIRPKTQAIWKNFSGKHKLQFIRHLRALWDIHRHRIDKKLYDNFTDLVAKGTITQHSGGIKNISVLNNKFKVELKAVTIEPDVIINTTGLKVEFDKTHSKLVASLLESDLIQPGPLNMGINVNDDYEVCENMYTIGFPMIGCLWETIAIPDIKFQALDIAKHIVNKG